MNNIEATDQKGGTTIALKMIKKATSVKGRLLIVDDEEPVRQILTEVFDRAGYEVVAAEDGLTALAAVREAPFDAVLLDIYLPDMNGLDVLKHLRDFDPRVPVIFITGGVPDAEVWEAVRDGRAYDCLRKPVTDFWKLPLLVEEARRAAREGLRSVPNVVG